MEQRDIYTAVEGSHIHEGGKEIILRRIACDYAEDPFVALGFILSFFFLSLLLCFADLRRDG